VITVVVEHQWLEDSINNMFEDVDEVVVSRTSIESMRADAIVSPANSFGFMDGGFDLAIRDVIGSRYESVLRQDICDLYDGELHIGEYHVLELDRGPYGSLICAPTMRVPKEVKGSDNAYKHMRAVLKAIRDKGYEDIIMTVPCVGVGRMDPVIAAKQMRMAWQSMQRVEPYSMDDAQRSDRELHYI